MVSASSANCGSSALRGNDSSEICRTELREFGRRRGVVGRDPGRELERWRLAEEDCGFGVVEEAMLSCGGVV